MCPMLGLGEWFISCAGAHPIGLLKSVIGENVVWNAHYRVRDRFGHTVMRIKVFYVVIFVYIRTKQVSNSCL